MRTRLIELTLAATMAVQGASGIETLGSHGLRSQAPPLGDNSSSLYQGHPRTSIARQFSGRITEVDRQNKTLTIDERQLGKEVLHLATDTRVLRGQENAAWEQLKVGDEVRATARKSGAINRVITIELGR
jgi:hypothetical protein